MLTIIPQMRLGTVEIRAQLTLNWYKIKIVSVKFCFYIMIQL